ncbi:MAG: hypothetical protein HYV97_01375 [Bdellovibrio sp.]|nr:hypothetical protein [Bdellovibrio sp.]
MKFIKIAIFIALFVSTAFAGNFNHVDQRLHALENTMNSMVDSIRIDIQNKSVKFPEYEGVFKDYLASIDKVSIYYKFALSEIRNYIETEFTRAYSELRAITDLQRENPNSEALKRLLKDKQARVEDAKKVLIRKANEYYQSSLRKLYTLEDKLVYPAKRSFNGRVMFWSINVVPVIGQLVVFSILSGMNENTHSKINHRRLANNLNETIRSCDYHGYCDSGHYSKAEFKQQLTTAAEKIYGSCRTAGCVYFINEDFTYWTHEFSTRINQDVLLMDGVVLKKIDIISNGLAKKRLFQMANIAAKNRPIARFE